MYSRREFDGRYGRIPRNYSGNAFREEAPPATVDLPIEPAVSAEPIEEIPAVKQEPASSEPSIPSGKFDLGRILGQSGIGSEELLLLGLILLLSQNDGRDDLPLWLLLLLFIR